ncbi:hypothetical protein B0H19DRAFT_1066517 [Mycena capillaripes]|nr:hypothetical protein B0H19DRAFT_1066517 [Mycena capillaripes]
MYTATHRIRDTVMSSNRSLLLKNTTPNSGRVTSIGGMVCSSSGEAAWELNQGRCTIPGTANRRERPTAIRPGRRHGIKEAIEDLGDGGARLDDGAAGDLGHGGEVAETDDEDAEVEVRVGACSEGGDLEELKKKSKERREEGKAEIHQTAEHSSTTPPSSFSPVPPPQPHASPYQLIQHPKRERRPALAREQQHAGPSRMRWRDRPRREASFFIELAALLVRDPIDARFEIRVRVGGELVHVILEGVVGLGYEAKLWRARLQSPQARAARSMAFWAPSEPQRAGGASRTSTSTSTDRASLCAADSAHVQLGALPFRNFSVGCGTAEQP